jgi:predicted anti-sigma-YlaC factor YlaD
MKDHPLHWIHTGLTCRDVAAWTSEYLDDHLSLQTKIRIGLHLASCTHCRTYVKQLLLARDAVTLLPKQYLSTVDRLCLRQHFVAHHEGLRSFPVIL